MAYPPTNLPSPSTISTVPHRLVVMAQASQSAQARQDLGRLKLSHYLPTNVWASRTASISGPTSRSSVTERRPRTVGLVIRLPHADSGLVQPSRTNPVQPGSVRAVLLCVALLCEALVLPIAWMLAAALGVLFTDGARWVSWLTDLGFIGPLLVSVPLVGAGLGLMLHPPRYEGLISALIVIAAVLNAAASLGVLWLNLSVSQASTGSRLAGIVFFAVPFALIAIGLLAEARRRDRPLR
jgi:hypothetical protein